MFKKLVRKAFLVLTASVLTGCGAQEEMFLSPVMPAELKQNEVSSSSFFSTPETYEKSHTKFFNQKYPVAIIAHRGYKDAAPENTLAAVKKAVQVGANMVELDVGLSKDGEVVVMHDDDLNRTTNGKGLVEEKTLQELKELDAGGWFNPVFKGEQIPTLAEVLEYAKGKISVNIEIKSYSVEKRSQVGIEKKVINLITQYGMEDYVMISSFSETAIKRVNLINPKVPTALLIVTDGIFSSQSRKAANVKADFVNELGTFINKGEIEKSHKNGLKVNAYTINDPNKMAKLIDNKIDGIITDRPDLALRVLEEKFPANR